MVIQGPREVNVYNLLVGVCSFSPCTNWNETIKQDATCIPRCVCVWGGGGGGGGGGGEVTSYIWHLWHSTDVRAE